MATLELARATQQKGLEGGKKGGSPQRLGEQGQCSKGHAQCLQERLPSGESQGPRRVCPPPPHLADEGELASPDVVTIQPEGEDSRQRQGAAHSSQIVQVGLGVLDVARAEAGEEEGEEQN